MKPLAISLLFFTGTVFGAQCDIAPLKKELIDQYKTILPVKNEKGEIGHARAKNFVFGDGLTRMEKENLLIGNFDLDINWLKGKKQTITSLIVATVDPETCTIKSFHSADTVNSSIGKK